MKIKFSVKILFRNKISLRVCDNIEIKNKKYLFDIKIFYIHICRLVHNDSPAVVRSS